MTPISINGHIPKVRDHFSNGCFFEPNNLQQKHKKKLKSIEGKMMSGELNRLSAKCDKTREALSKLAIVASVGDQEEFVENGNVLNHAKAQADATHKAMQAQEREMRNAREHTLSRQAKLRDLKAEISAAKSKQENMLNSVQRARKAKVLTENEKFLTKKHDEVRARISELEKKIALVSSVAPERTSSALEQVTNDIDKFTVRLGLRVQRVAGGFLRVEFRYIDPSNPDRVFSFNVCTDNDVYEIRDVYPPLSGVEDLVEQLNRDSPATGFSTFCKAMRRKFREPFVSY